MISSFVSLIEDARSLETVMQMVEEGVLEELFIASAISSDVAGIRMEKGAVLAFSFALKKEAFNTLTQSVPSADLDTLGDDFFCKEGEEFVLKGVLYPQNEHEEEALIAKLL